MCQGNCDGDSDCASGLKCFQRDGYTAIPDCWGSGKDDWDYCAHDDSVRITEVEVLGVEMDCPYSSFTDEDGNYAIPVLNPSGDLPKNMHAGIIPTTTDIFDPNDVLLLPSKIQARIQSLS